MLGNFFPLAQWDGVDKILAENPQSCGQWRKEKGSPVAGKKHGFSRTRRNKMLNKVVEQTRDELWEHLKIGLSRILSDA